MILFPFAFHFIYSVIVHEKSADRKDTLSYVQDNNDLLKVVQFELLGFSSRLPRHVNFAILRFVYFATLKFRDFLKKFLFYM